MHQSFGVYIMLFLIKSHVNLGGFNSQYFTDFKDLSLNGNNIFLVASNLVVAFHMQENTVGPRCCMFTEIAL